MPWIGSQNGWLNFEQKSHVKLSELVDAAIQEFGIEF